MKKLVSWRMVLIIPFLFIFSLYLRFICVFIFYIFVLGIFSIKENSFLRKRNKRKHLFHMVLEKWNSKHPIFSKTKNPSLYCHCHRPPTSDRCSRPPLLRWNRCGNRVWLFLAPFFCASFKEMLLSAGRSSLRHLCRVQLGSAAATGHRPPLSLSDSLHNYFFGFLSFQNFCFFLLGLFF